MAKKIDMCPTPECPTPRLARVYHRLDGEYKPYRDPFGCEVFRCVTHGLAIQEADRFRMVIQ